MDNQTAMTYFYTVIAVLILFYELQEHRNTKRVLADLRNRLEEVHERYRISDREFRKLADAPGRASAAPPSVDPVRIFLEDFKYGRCDYGEKSLCFACGAAEFEHAGNCKLARLVNELRMNGKLKAEIAKKVREEIERAKRPPGRACCHDLHPPGECPLLDSKSPDVAALLSAESVRGSSASPLVNFFNFTTPDRNVRHLSSTESFHCDLEICFARSLGSGVSSGGVDCQGPLKEHPFRIGQIVRRKLTGKLYRIMDIPDPEEVNAAEVYPPATGTTTLCGHSVYGFEPAVPVEGERWQWHACGNLNHGSAFDHEPTTCPPLTDKCRDVAIERSAVEHGCLTPIPYIFGMGNA